MRGLEVPRTPDPHSIPFAFSMLALVPKRLQPFCFLGFVFSVLGACRRRRYILVFVTERGRSACSAWPVGLRFPTAEKPVEKPLADRRDCAENAKTHAAHGVQSVPHTGALARGRGADAGFTGSLSRGGLAKFSCGFPK